MKCSQPDSDLQKRARASKKGLLKAERAAAMYFGGVGAVLLNRCCVMVGNALLKLVTAPMKLCISPTFVFGRLWAFSYPSIARLTVYGEIMCFSASFRM